jgi:oxygen-independent coproporphyrinogen III oxidase
MRQACLNTLYQQGEGMSELIQQARAVYETLPRHKLTDRIFLREPGKYYTLINYPPLKGMVEHHDERFPFLKPSSNSKRLYIHIPFCSGHCTFCNYKIIVGAQEHWTYLNYIIKEIDLLKGYFGDLSVDNVLFGGGTPSLLSLQELEYLYSNVLSRVNVTTAYLGFEVHPEMVNNPDCEAKLKLLKEMGVGRVNIGVQAFDDNVLRAVNRRHTASDCYRIIEMCQKLDFDFINFDLILGLPRQSLQSWEHTIKTALELQPTSISPFYCWMKPSSPIYTHYRRKPQDFPSQEEIFLMIVMYMEEFKRQGYRFGTIDYYFKPKQAIDEAQPLSFDTFLHTDFDVLPLGISGYGLTNDTRYMNQVELPPYYAAIDRGVLPIGRYYTLPEDDIIRLNLMYSLRYDNVNVQEFKRRYGIDLLVYFAETFQNLQEKQLLEIDSDQIRLTYLGKIFSDEVCMFFVSDRVRQNIQNDERSNDRDTNLLETYSYMYDITNV